MGTRFAQIVLIAVVGASVLYLQARQIDVLETFVGQAKELRMDPNKLETRWKTTINGVSAIHVVTTTRHTGETDADLLTRHATACAADLVKYPIATS